MIQKLSFNAELRVLLLEDSAQLQKLLQAMLNEIPAVKVVASVCSQAAAVEALRSDSADLAIVDLELASGSGLGFLRSLSEDLDLPRKLSVVVFSNSSNLVIRHRCMHLGANAFFDKSFQVEELLEYVQAAAFGKAKSLAP